MAGKLVKKQELVVFLLLVCILVAVNIVNIVKSHRMERCYAALVEELTIPISINEASVEELQLLPGIGPSLALRIVEYRDTHDGFKTLQSLKQVKGIGDKLFERILPYIRE